MKNKHCIYKVLNKCNGKCYIGRTVNFETRWRDHCRNRKSVLGKAIKRYGVKNFEITIVAENLSLTDANRLERTLISLNNSLIPNGYNVSQGEYKH